MLYRWSGKKNVDLDFTTWETIFEEKLKKEVDARERWAFLLSKGCKPRALKICLFRILVDLDNLHWREWWASTGRAASRHKAARVREDAEVLSRLSLDYSDLEYVDHLLDQASKTLRRAAAEADLEAAERSPLSPYQNLLPDGF